MPAKVPIAMPFAAPVHALVGIWATAPSLVKPLVSPLVSGAPAAPAAAELTAVTLTRSQSTLSRLPAATWPAWIARSCPAPSTVLMTTCLAANLMRAASPILPANRTMAAIARLAISRIATRARAVAMA